MTVEVEATVAAAPAAVAATPAAVTTAAVTADPNPAAVVESTLVAYEPTGSANADYALGQIFAAGIDMSHPAAQAALEGDFDLLRHALASKGVAGGDHLISMLQRAATEASDADEKIAKGIEADVIALAGSQEHWNVVMDWGKEHADEGEKAALNKMFADPTMHKIAAGYLLGAYDRAGGPREAQAGVTNPDAVAARPSNTPNTEPLNRVQFADEAGKLRAKLGDAYINSPEYLALGRRLAQ